MIALLALAAAATTPIAPLLERVRVSVPDAREVHDLQVCQPRKISRDGRKFLTDVALSRPREPRRFYVATWKDGRVDSLSVYPIDSSVGPTAGFATMILRSTERKFEACRWVPAVELAAGWAALDAR